MFADKYKKTLVIGVAAALLLEVFLLIAAFDFLPGKTYKPAIALNNGAPSPAVAEASPVGTNIIADIVEKTSPAVVKIETLSKTGGQVIDPFFNDPFFRQFFGTPGPFRVEPDVRKGMGSGFIISKDGYILTNEHVIDQASEIKVYLAGRDKPLAARVVGKDFELDLAVLKVDAGNNLPYIELGDSDAARVGEWVIAIGNPYGLDHTVTTGVISAKGRPITVDDRQYKNLLQTDASINPGNSGGPLLNLSGKVVGINTAVNAQAQGIGFAIPANTVKSVLDTLISKGKISRPQMGVYIQTLTAELAEQLGLKSKQGAIISGIIPGSPAEKAGLRQGDVILQIDRQNVQDAGDVTDIIQKHKVGDKIALLVETSGTQKYVTMTLEEK
ncbi:trypsin-like peptidase domain-containing protein [Desulfallas sp. Bu1-1]|uniref:trypsin-like peptidase domain-containing protein n=1 Tax=Desulfallas sp. Bu1-1 TaxID=2787620 RepID=UPI00189CD300|nr:trypsin-like peptidase domain-containing protein [Desulfallas sp. Bu1-1]MBF7083109.1 trypsin-like peptidase domain-containing protein [Desulfallas sp. Bu1-1]